MATVRHPVVRGGLAAWLLVLSGCGVFDGGGDARPTPPATTIAAPNPEVIDAGSAPRRPLRYRFEKGATTTVQLTLDLDVARGTGSSQLAVDNPAVRETVVFTVEAVGGDEASVSFEFTGADIDRTGSDLTDKELLKLTAALQPLVGIGGQGRVTDRGSSTSFRYDLPEDLDPDVAATLRRFEDQLATLAIPFPAQEIGVGATWRTVATSRSSGIELRQVATYEVTELTDRALSYRVNASQTAKDQELDPDTLPARTRARLISANLSATGTGRLELDALAASSDTSLSGDQVVEVTQEGAAPSRSTQRIDIDLDVKASGSG